MKKQMFYALSILSFTFLSANQPRSTNGFIPAKHPIAIGSQAIAFTKNKGQAGCLVQFTPCVSPTVTALCTPTIICRGSSATLTASGADTYTWSTGATGSMIVVSPQIIGTIIYTVTGEDLSGTNKAVVQLKVVFGPAPTITATSSTSLICSGENSTLTAGGADTYLWSTGGTGTNIAVSPSVSTTYTVKGTTDANGCFNYTTVSQSVTPCTSVTKSVDGPMVFGWQETVYPNPNNGEFFIQLEKENTVNLVIYNLTGEKILSATFHDQIPSVDISSQPSGIYFVEMQQGENMSRTKLIKY